MADTNFTNGVTLTDAAWFQYVNDLVYGRSGQLPFPATQIPSSNPNTLDDYDEYTAASTACSGAITTSVVWKLAKVGKVVTLALPETTGNTGGGVANFVFGVAAPAKYRPAVQQRFAIVILDNGATPNVPGMLVVATTGVISVYKDLAATGTFTVSGGLCGTSDATSVSWLV